MTTTDEAWGFREVLTVNADLNAFLKAMNAAALDRGIKPNEPSDALDMSRDLILDEAAQSLGLEWAVVDHTLRLWPSGYTIKWDTIQEDA